MSRNSSRLNPPFPILPKFGTRKMPARGAGFLQGSHAKPDSFGAKSWEKSKLCLLKDQGLPPEREQKVISLEASLGKATGKTMKLVKIQGNGSICGHGCRSTRLPCLYPSTEQSSSCPCRNSSVGEKHQLSNCLSPPDSWNHARNLAESLRAILAGSVLLLSTAAVRQCPKDLPKSHHS